MTRRSLFAFACVTTTLAACGGADHAPARSGGAPPREEAPPAEPKTVEEAQRQIAQAVDELNGRYELKASESKTAPAAEPSPTDRPSQYNSDAMTNQCASPCRALASMKRAVEALCRMTGESDTKCVDARKTLADNVGKTASCKCSS
jgi:hypothetical protein